MEDLMEKVSRTYIVAFVGVDLQVLLTAVVGEEHRGMRGSVKYLRSNRQGSRVCTASKRCQMNPWITPAQRSPLISCLISLSTPQLDESKAYEEMVESLTTKNLEIGERCGELEATIADLESSVEMSEELETQQAEDIRELQVSHSIHGGRFQGICLLQKGQRVALRTPLTV